MQSRFNSNTTYRVIVVIAALVAVSIPSFAHQQWLNPNFFHRQDESAWLTFDHTFSDNRFDPAQCAIDD